MGTHPGRKRRRKLEAPSRRRVSAYLRGGLASHSLVSEPFVLGLHSEVLSHGDGQISSGRYRDGPVRVRWKGRVVYVAPAADSVPSLMTEFFDSVVEREGSDPVKAAGMALLGLLKIHPFSQANGRTARALATYMLLSEGYVEKPLRNLEKYVDESLDQYYEALALSSTENPGPWDTYFSRAANSVFRPPGSGASEGFLALVGESFRKALR